MKRVKYTGLLPSIFTAPTPQTLPLPCIHRSSPPIPTGESVDCPTCTGNVSLKVFACAAHPEGCTLAKRVVGKACCDAACLERTTENPEDFGPIGKRHLVYHLMPAPGDVWRWNVDTLREHWTLFDGSKTVAVMTGENLTPVREVRKYLPPDCEVIPLPNNPALREVVSWVPLWERLLAVADKDDAVLYAHAKGVTRKSEPVTEWTKWMYAACLNWPAVESQLRAKPIAGAFRRVGKDNFGSASRSLWHYTGSFFWARVGDFKQRPWKQIEQRWWGNEAWPGTAYKLEESGCLLASEPTPIATLDLYHAEVWEKLRPILADWQKTNRLPTEVIPSAGSP